MEERENNEKGEREEEERLIEGMAVVDFDVLCSTVAMQTNGKWRMLENGYEEENSDGFGGGVFRLWEGELLDCFEDRRLAIQSSCCPCYRFGKNMKRAGFGSCFIQGVFHFFLLICAFLNGVAFAITGRHYFLYLAIGFIFVLGTYMGFFRAQIRKKFNIKGSDGFVDDCIYHLICPLCSLCQESRTLVMNNVQDGIWHGRGDTICIGTYGDGNGNKVVLELNSPISSAPSMKSPDPCQMQKSVMSV